MSENEMKTPECRCFTDATLGEEQQGQQRTLRLATEVAVQFMAGLNYYQFCHKSGPHVVAMTMAMMLRSVCDCETGDDEMKSRALFRERVKELPDMLISHEEWLNKEAAILQSEEETKQ